MPKTTVGSYKGSPTISLIADTESGARYPFTFGVNKAKLILACLEQVKAFVARYEPAQVDPMGVDKQYEDDCAQTTGR